MPSELPSSAAGPAPSGPSRRGAAAGLAASSSQPELLALAAFAAVSVYFSYVGRGEGFFPTLGHFFASSLAVSALFATLVLLLSRGAGATTPGRAARQPLLHQALLVVMLVTVQDRNQNITGVCAAALLVLVATTYLWKRGRLSEIGKLRVDLVLTLVVALAARIGRIVREPLGARSDMLVLIEKALDAVLAGRSPYRTYSLDHLASGPYELPLTYLPGTWLAYLPAHLLRIDLRFTNALLEGAIVGVLALWLARRSSSFPDLRHRWIGAGFLAVYALNGQLLRRVDTEMAPFDLVLLLLFLALVAGSDRSLFASLGLAFATSPLGLLLAPFVGAHVARAKGIRVALRGALGSVGIAVAALAPFAVASPAGFKSGLWDHWRALRAYPYSWAVESMMNLNFSVLFYRFQAQAWLPLIQVTLLAALFAVGFGLTGGYRGVARTLAWSAFALFLFVAFNLVVWEYLYQPVFLLVALAAIAAAREPASEGSRR